MSARNDGGPAAPAPVFDKDGYVVGGHPGMTLRDWFAGQALAGMATGRDWSTRGDADMSMLAEQAYIIADAMLAAREVKP